MSIRGGVVSLFFIITIWLLTFTRQARARRAAECALIESERRLRELLTKAETELAERKHAERQLMAGEEALRQTEVRYREVIENANDIIFTVDREGYCLSMNRAGRQVSGYTAEDGRGIHLAHIVAPEHAAYAKRQLQRVLDGEVVPTFELRILSKDGRRLTLELNVHLLHGEGGRTSVQGIARDVTARKELEEQLRQSQKMEALGRLSGGIAHDFNNLLTVIVGYSELVSGALPSDSLLRRDVDEIRRAASSAVSLTRQLLIFSRKDVVQMVDLHAVLHHQRPFDRHRSGAGHRAWNRSAGRRLDRHCQYAW